jgi:hypothetical protein
MEVDEYELTFVWYLDRVEIYYDNFKEEKKNECTTRRTEETDL